MIAFCLQYCLWFPREGVQSGRWSWPSQICEDNAFEDTFRKKEGGDLGGGEGLGLVGLGVSEASGA